MWGRRETRAWVGRCTGQTPRAKPSSSRLPKGPDPIRSPRLASEPGPRPALLSPSGGPPRPPPCLLPPVRGLGWHPLPAGAASVAAHLAGLRRSRDLDLDAEGPRQDGKASARYLRISCTLGQPLGRQPHLRQTECRGTALWGAVLREGLCGVLSVVWVAAPWLWRVRLCASLLLHLLSPHPSQRHRAVGAGPAGRRHRALIRAQGRSGGTRLELRHLHWGPRGRGCAGGLGHLDLAALHPWRPLCEDSRMVQESGPGLASGRESTGGPQVLPRGETRTPREDLEPAARAHPHLRCRLWACPQAHQHLAVTWRTEWHSTGRWRAAGLRICSLTGPGSPSSAQVSAHDTWLQHGCHLAEKWQV